MDGKEAQKGICSSMIPAGDNQELNSVISNSVHGNSSQQVDKNTTTQTQTETTPAKTEQNVESNNEISTDTSQVTNNPIPTTVVRSEHGDDEDDNDNKDEEELMDEEELRTGLKEILDDTDHKGDFCVGKNISTKIPHLSPRITIKGMEDNEQFAYPLIDYQAKRIRSFAEEATVRKGLDTVLDKSIHKAWEIDAAQVKFCDLERWQTALKQIVLDCSASLGINTSQQANVTANLYKLFLYEPGGYLKKHHHTEKESGMFGTLIIQLPSNFTGGAIHIEHAGEKKTFDFSSNSSEGLYATAFYADCEHELLPIQSGWRLCLAYNLVVRHSPMQLLPSAQTITYQMQYLRKLANQWDTLFAHGYGYVLEQNYTETNLKFASLEGRDKGVVDMLRGMCDVDGNPLFVVYLVRISKIESGKSSHDDYDDFDPNDRFHYDEDADHSMVELHDTQLVIDFWIGPDDNRMDNFNRYFDLEKHLLIDDDAYEIFGDNPSRFEYDPNEIEYGSSLDFFYYHGAVVFWPRSKNINNITLSSGQNQRRQDSSDSDSSDSDPPKKKVRETIVVD